MKIPDYDGLSRSQISRINRLQMTRYRIGKSDIYETGGTLIMPVMSRERHRNKMVAFVLTVICLLPVICIIGAVILMIEPPKSETTLFTSLPSDLDDQSPSITIYGGKDLGKP